MARTQGVRAALAVAALALATSCGPLRDKVTLSLPEHHGTIPENGLRVIILPDPSTPLVQIDVRYEVGANEDPAGKAGIAHLVEHMMFQHRPAGPEQPPVFEVLQQIAVQINAYTHWEKTHYWNLIRKDDLETILAIEAARMGMGCDTLTEEQFLREREVVRNEIRQRLGDPSSILIYKALEAVYPEGHPYRHLIGGDDKDLANIQFQDVCDFMKNYYTPSRAVLVIAGNVTPEEVSPIIGKYFGAIPKREPKPRVPVPPIELKKQRIELELDIEEPTVMVMWAMPARFSKDDAAAQFMIGFVTGLVNREGRDWDFATSVQPEVLGAERAPVFAITVTMRKVGDVGKVLDAVERATKRAYKLVDTDSDTRDQIAVNKASYIMGFESLAARTDLYADYEQFAPDSGYFAGELRRIDTEDRGRIRSYLKSHLSMGNAVILVAKPKAGAERGGKQAGHKFSAATADNRTDGIVDPSEAVRPLPIPAQAETNLPGKTFTMGNGMKVILQPTKEGLPVMSVRLIFNVGSAHESPKKAGLAQIAARFLEPPMGDAGIGGELASADPIGAVGAERDVAVDGDTTTFSVRGLNIYPEPIIKGLERWIKAGDYNQEAIENYRKSLGFAFKRKSFRANRNFGKAFAMALYGEDHPYALTGQPTVDSLGNIGRDAAYDFKSTHYSAKNATIIVAGNFDVGQIEGLIRDNFGDWGGGHEDKPVPSVLPARSGVVTVGVENQDEPSAQVRIGYPIRATVDGQYGARRLLAAMLTDRMSVVRTQLGASYGVYAFLADAKGPGAYAMGGAVDAERCGVAVAAMRQAVDSLRKAEDFDAAFAKARRLILRNLLTSSGMSGDVADRLAFVASYALPTEFYDKLIHQVAAATPAQVKALIELELVPQNEVVAILGTKAQVEKCVADAGLTLTKWVPLDEEKK